MRRGLLLAAGSLGALVATAAAGWAALVRVQGDSDVDYVGEMTGVVGDARTIHGEVTLTNRGAAGAVVHKVVGRVVAGPPGRVYVTRMGTRPPDRGYWQSNCLVPGETCVAEVEIELDEPGAETVTIELDAHDIGRRLKVHRTKRFVVAVPDGPHPLVP